MKFNNGTSSILWDKILKRESGLQFDAIFRVLPTKGNMAWEYNPLRNLRLDQDMFYYNGKYYPVNTENKTWLVSKASGKEITIPGAYKYSKGELVDFITDLLSFDLKHPVNITPSYSYDGSVDLILNDGKNQPRLINTRFSTTGRNTYEVINRKGDNDTNIYDMGNLFDIDTSLYKKTNKIPILTFNGTPAGGSLKVGNYHFYFKYADADGNETDFVAESGLVSVFRGMNSPVSINTGHSDQNSLKCVSFTIKNVDNGYLYLHVYYTRSSAQINLYFVTTAVKINQKFLVNTNGTCNILITGEEECLDIALTDINLSYNVILSALSLEICQNMLFMANVQKVDIPYEELLDLSLRFLPYLYTEKYKLNIDQVYSIHSNDKGYYDPKFIYSTTGYWNKDLYRLGIVYILKDNTLSPVFNIRGRENVKSYGSYRTDIDGSNSEAYTKIKTIINKGTPEQKRQFINYDEISHMVIKGGDEVDSIGNGFFENVKGVVSLDSEYDTNTILGFDIRTDEDTLNELRKYVKGFFFVRQRRMPMTLCQGITIGIEKNSRLPAIPTIHGVTNIKYDNTFIETKDTNPEEIHFVMEGFLSRYTYKLKTKSSGFWSKLGKALAVTALAAAGVVGSVFLGPEIGAAMGFAISAVVSSGTVLAATAIGAAAIMATTFAVALTQEIILDTQIARHSKAAAKPYRGRSVSVPSGYKREEVEDSRKLDAEFKQRVIILDTEDCRTEGLLVPEYNVNPAKFNQLFNGDDFAVEYTTSLAITNKSNWGYFQNDNNRHFYIPGYEDSKNKRKTNYVSLLSVPDGVAAVGIDLTLFRAKAGEFNLPNKFELTKTTYKGATLNSNSDLVRGNFGPYVAMLGFLGPAATTVNIKVPGYDENNMANYIAIRMSDHTAYSAISDRIDISTLHNPVNNLANDTTNHPYIYSEKCFRGDCYICQVTQRINRNLNDPSAPYNESIVDPKTWRNYDAEDPATMAKINLGDVNAVLLGMWVTFKIRSNYNLNIRTLDDSYIEETAECGHVRGYYPYHPMSTDGSYKIPESTVYNLGFSKSLSERTNFEVPDMPYIRNWFGTRIMYSDVQITDGFKNGYRTFRGTAYRDYTREYGSITKIVEFAGNLIVVFEHGVGFLEVNEKAIAALSESGYAYMTTNNVLPEKLTIISDAIGSQWADSVIKVPIRLGGRDNLNLAASVIFGVDTVAKKIWMCDGHSVECISDKRVLEFLNNNITLGERDLTPVLGVRNVKTVYNAFKQDVMFTFYDCMDGFDDKAWNLCYNMTLQKFTTFYSWIPAFMNNIDNIPFSFDRDVAKNIGKLGISKSDNDFSDGIVLSNNIISNSLSEYRIGKLGLANRVLPFVDNNDPNILYSIQYEIVRDDFRNDILFAIEKDGDDVWLVFNTVNELIPSYNDYNKDGIISTSSSSGERNVLRSEGGGKILIKGVPEGKRYTALDIHSELYYRNLEGNKHSDWEESSNIPEYNNTESAWRHRLIDEEPWEYKHDMANLFTASVNNNLPIFKDRSGKKKMLPEEDRINLDQIVRLLNIRANIFVTFGADNKNMFDIFKSKEGSDMTKNTETTEGSNEITSYTVNCGYYESTVAVTTQWNMQFLTSDFWKHGLAGLINITDDIKPTVWYGKQHPFEFECVVVNDPETHKIFLNLELIANKAEPESFHFEVIGESYDFAKDKPTMFFRQEARKALFLYNGVNISYNKDFLKILPKQSPKSAELIYNYYERLDKRNEILDTYVGDAKYDGKYNNLDSYLYMYKYWANLTPNHDYRHLSGAEIVYYKNRNEYRIWQHLPAININKLPQDTAASIIRGNCQYLEDRWKISINPLLISYKNEYTRRYPGPLCVPRNSLWASAMTKFGGKSNTMLPPITIMNTSLPSVIRNKNAVDFPEWVSTQDFPGSSVTVEGESLLDRLKRIQSGKYNALYGLYYLGTDANSPIDRHKWLDVNYIYGTDFGPALNRKETDLRDRFLKVRIRYSGEDLAVIDALNTIYTISYA